ncbi:hypothetical protein L1987_48428 [Smallanthus sonchifolius]|uniref:Uncharacterized protein n=1 Tax=Smallanthus sonchifolius TaxID=185202 RepID=A0ACB9FRA8_9ASTR|nr:hypothetical protein L1987_48428 [Smallanthus sonchifolius]
MTTETVTYRWLAPEMSGSTMLNLSLLTSNMWSVLIRIFAYHEQEMSKEIQDAEEKMRKFAVEIAAASVKHGQVAFAGSLAEFYETQAQWGHEKTTKEHEQMFVKQR